MEAGVLHLAVLAKEELTERNERGLWVVGTPLALVIWLADFRDTVLPDGKPL